MKEVTHRKEVTQGGYSGMAGAIGKVALPTRALAVLVAVAALLPASKAFGIALDLTVIDQGTINGAIYSTIDSEPTGTGVYGTFLSIQANGIEQGYNGKGGKGKGYLDSKDKPKGNYELHVGDLAAVTIDGNAYYAFELDANEKGKGKDALLSIDNIRVYTSATDTAGIVGDNVGALDSLGTLRYAQNPLLTSTAGFNTANSVTIDGSKKEGKKDGGSSDLIVYVPVSNFAGAGAGDYVYFYNLNGVNNPSNSESEDWSAWTTSVPDGGNSLLLLGSAVTALGIFAGRGKIGTSA